MSLLVEDLLTLVRMDEGRPMREDPVDLLELALAAAENARAGFPGRVVRVQNDTRSVPVTVGDSARLHQVVGNLVTNALRHAGEDATVDIRLSRVEVDGDGDAGASGDGESTDMIALDISDDGAGIAPKDVPHLFERFYRADVSRSRASGGSGLGLSIVQRLVERHNGTISVESELGEGTTFHIQLPAWKDEGLDESFDDFEDGFESEVDETYGEVDPDEVAADGEGREGGDQEDSPSDPASGSPSESSSESPSDSSTTWPAPTDKRPWGDRRNPNSWGR